MIVYIYIYIMCIIIYNDTHVTSYKESYTHLCLYDMYIDKCNKVFVVKIWLRLFGSINQIRLVWRRQVVIVLGLYFIRPNGKQCTTGLDWTSYGPDSLGVLFVKQKTTKVERCFFRQSQPVNYSCGFTWSYRFSIHANSQATALKPKCWRPSHFYCLTIVAVATVLLHGTDRASVEYCYMRLRVEVSIPLFGVAICRSVFLACNVKRES